MALETTTVRTDEEAIGRRISFVQRSYKLSNVRGYGFIATARLKELQGLFRKAWPYLKFDT